MNCQLVKYLFGLFLNLSVIQIVGQTTDNFQVQQDFYTRFYNISEFNGLSNNKVLDIIQDPYGFIWIATTDGLNRYDGYKFKIYKHNPDDSLSISDNFITSLDFDYKGNLWIGTKNGLNKLNRSNESFFKYPIHSIKNQGLSNSYVREVYADRKVAILWVETVDGTLNKINLETNQIEHFKHKKVDSEFYNYHSIFEDSKGNIWVGGRDMGPYKLEPDAKEPFLIRADPKNLKKKRDNDIACIFEDSKERYWMSDMDGFYQYFSEKNEFEKLLATSTFDIIESSDYGLWLATGRGLYYYNPSEKDFIRYQFNPNDNFSIASNHLNCLLLDTRGNLWIGTDNGLSIILRKKNIFKYYRSISKTKGNLPSSPVSDILEDSEKNVWMSTMGSGIIKWDRGSDKFETFDQEFGDKKVSCLFEDKQKNIWIGLWSGTGFYKFDKTESSFQRYAIQYDSCKADWYNDFYEDTKGRLWVGVWGHRGISVFDRDSSKFKKYSFRLNESPHNWPVYQVFAFHDKVWCNSKFNYQYNFNKLDETFQCLQNIQEDEVLPEWRKHFKKSPTNLFDYNKVNKAIVDSNGVVFFATNKGLIQLKDNKFRLFSKVIEPILALSEVNHRNHFYFATGNEVHQYNCKTDDSNVLEILDAETVINALVEVDRMLWIGTNKGLIKMNLRTSGVNKINSISGKITQIERGENNLLLIGSNMGLFILEPQKQELQLFNLENSFEKGLISQYINTIYYQPYKGNCFIGTDKGLIQYAFRKNKFKPIDSFNGISIHEISSNHPDTLWLATENGLARYLTRKDKTTFYNSFTKHQTTSRLTKFIFEDSKNNVWIGSTNNGLSRINTLNYEIGHFLSNKGEPKSLWGKNTNCIYELADGRILIGASGINIFDYSKGAFSHFTKTEGLPTNDILGITQDSNEKIWIATHKGLVKLNTKFEIENVYQSDWGLETYNFTEAIKRLNSGEILLGSKNGFYSFYPEQLAAIENLSEIQITGFKVFDEEKLSDFTERKQVVLNYDENFFTIEFTDFTYQNSNPEFLYRLKGIDEDWVNSGKLNQAIYTKIPHGKYLFEVKKKNQSNVAITTLQIEIVPPFWKTTWFIALEIVLVLLFVLLLYRQKINEYKMREKHLQLEQTLLRSQMNPHFIFNALIAIQNFIFENNPKEAGRYLSKFAKLMRLFLQHTREDFIPLSQELEILSHYLELQKLRFNNSFYFTINCVEEIDPESISIPPMMAQPFIENAIEHGFKGIEYQGEIDIKYYIHNKHIRIAIIDNGIGIKKSMENKGEDNELHESLATQITTDRLKGFSNRFAKYDLEIVDRLDLLTKENGTRVTIRVPFIYNY